MFGSFPPVKRKAAEDRMRHFVIALTLSLASLGTIAATGASAQAVNGKSDTERRQECRHMGTAQNLKGDELTRFVETCMNRGMSGSSVPSDRVAECHARAVAKGLSPERTSKFESDCLAGIQ